VSRLRCGEDARLVVGVEEALTLKEAIDVANLQLETAQLLLQLRAALLRFGASHLEGDETLLRALLKAAATPIDPVPKADLHLLKLVKHDMEVGIHGLVRADAAP
jgi:hypothetical protein